MIKKLTAYSFILFANIILLAHAVIPHHHHHQQVCIERTDCVGNDVTHTHNTPESDHQRDCNTDLTACVLKQVFLIPSAQGRILKACDNCTDSHNQGLYKLSNFEYLDLQPVLIIVTSIPEFSPFLKSFVTSTLGLRAPPIV